LDKKLISIGATNGGICRLKSSISRYIPILNPIDCLIYPDCFPYLTYDYLNKIKTAGNCYGSDTFFEAISYFLNDIGLNNNPLRLKKIGIDIIIDEPFYLQPPFGTDLADDHQKVNNLLMYLEWFRVLNTSYQNMVLGYSLMIADQILLNEGYELVSISNNFKQYQRNGNNLFLRRKIRFNEFIKNKYAQIILIGLIFKILILMNTNQNSKSFINKSIVLFKYSLSIPRKILTLISNLTIKLIRFFILIIKNNFKLIFPFIPKILIQFYDYFHFIYKEFLLTNKKKLKVDYEYKEDVSMPVSIFLKKHIFGVLIVNSLEKKYQFLRRFK
jgi:uncharacterized integral membrane protein